MADEDTSKIVNLNIGGKEYTTLLRTVSKYPSSKLASIFRETTPNENGRYFIDADGEMFIYILNFLRRERLNLPKNFAEYDRLLAEAEFYRIQPLIDAIREEKKAEHTVVLCIISSVNAITACHFKSDGVISLLSIGRVYNDYVSFLQKQGYKIHRARREIGNDIFEWAGAMHTQGYISNPAISCEGTDALQFRRQLSPHNVAFDSYEIWGK